MPLCGNQTTCQVSVPVGVDPSSNRQAQHVLDRVPIQDPPERPHDGAVVPASIGRIAYSPCRTEARRSCIADGDLGALPHQFPPTHAGGHDDSGTKGLFVEELDPTWSEQVGAVPG